MTAVARAARVVRVVRALAAERTDEAGARGSDVDDEVAVEEPLEIQLFDTGSPGIERGGGWRSIAVVMRTPDDDDAVDEDLAIGFLCTEGLVRSIDDVASVAACSIAPTPQAEGNVMRVRLRDGVVVDWTRLQRSTFASSSCGVCGKATIDAACAVAAPIEPAARGDVDRDVDVDVVWRFVDRLRALQPVFARTGGLHGALLGTRAGDVVVVREDVGRHNAVDKVLGHLLRQRLDPAEHVLIVSGRVAFELVQKCLAARLPLIAGVGAPTSLAVALAEAGGVCVAGFVKAKTLNVYAHAERLRGIEHVVDVDDEG